MRARDDPDKVINEIRQRNADREVLAPPLPTEALIARIRPHAETPYLAALHDLHDGKPVPPEIAAALR